MKRSLLLFLPLFISQLSFCQSSFKQDQLRYQRVRTAYAEKEQGLKEKLQQHGLAFGEFELFIRIFKKEKETEVWVKGKQHKTFQLLTTYRICSSSGSLGPKRKQGDRQVPEGFYFIDRFNPHSNFYLSLGINYPNQSDKVLGKKGSLGGDIFIHGNCVTIGCVPLTDPIIKELYVLATEAKNAGNKTQVHIFPSRDFDSLLRENHPSELKTFWQNLRPGFEYFEKNCLLFHVSVDSDGKYLVKD